jgi:hypothetical protein
MRALVSYLSWEMLAIHILTGALFAVITVVFAVALIPDYWWVAIALIPVQLFGWWGWWAEARFVHRALRDLRRL